MKQSFVLYFFSVMFIHLADISAQQYVDTDVDMRMLGTHLIFRSANDQEAFAQRIEDDGALYFYRNGTSGEIGLYIDDDPKRVGINTALARTDLHVRQAVIPSLNGPNAVVSNLAGLTLESSSAPGIDGTLFVHTDGDLTFAFNGVYRSFINDVSGSYIAVSDRRSKTAIQHMENVLDKVQSLKPSSYLFVNDTSGRRSIGLVAQDVEKLFPEIVYTKGDTYGIAYQELSVIAIKAIQEQQALIDKLINRIEALEHRMAGAH